MTGVPISKLSTSEKQRYLNIESKLSESIIGQEEAIKAVAQAVKRGRMGINKKNSPISVVLAVGESGCGKTLLAKKLAEEIFGSTNDLVRFDMSEYNDKTSVNKLIGSNFGYVDSDKGGLLTEAIKNKKHCVLLLDEIEKADKEVHNLLLQIFDNGEISDSSGVKVSFKDVIIIMTSNVGAKDASLLGGGVGFNTNIEDNKKNIVNKSLRQVFNPEFVNRISNIIHFNSLTGDDLKQIISLELNILNKKLSELEYGIIYNDDLIDYLFKIINKDGSPGARKINRAIQNEIEDLIVDLYLENDFEKGHMFEVNINDDKIEIK